MPASLPELEFEDQTVGDLTITRYAQGTNGLVYVQAVAPVPQLDDHSLALLPTYTNLLTELGLGDTDYLETQHRQSASVGSINAFLSMRGSVDDEQSLQANMVLSSKALARHTNEQSRLLRDTLQSVRFDEHARIRDIVSQQRARRDQSVTGNGHGLAMSAASAGMSPLARLNHQLSGMAGIKSLRVLDESLRDDQAAADFAERLQVLHNTMLGQPTRLLAIAEKDRLDGVCTQLAQDWQALVPGSAGDTFTATPVRERVLEMWITNTQVNFSARAYPTVPVGHVDAAALTILGGFLRNGFLHRAIREQGGAYGGGASQDSGIAAFRFYSYRDPRLEETLSDFDASVSWMLEEQHDQRPLEEAILGVIGSLDKPSSPAGEAKQHFHNRLFGRTHEQREEFRQRILDVTLDDLRRVAQTYLRPELASTAVITNASQLDATADLRDSLGLIVQEL